MANNQTRRLTPSVRAEDEDTLERLKQIANYKPANPAYSLETFTKVVTDMKAAQAEEEQTDTTLQQKRAVANQREWDTHNTAIGVKDSVEVQYGKNSVEVQMIGRKTEAERKRPVQKPKPAPPK
jgi:hypothetical protein